MRFLVSVFVAWMVFAPGGMAQQLAWEPVGGPYGGEVLEFEEPERGRLLARTRQGWHELHGDRWMRLDWPLALRRIAVGGTVWLSAGADGLYRSTDGEAWQHVGWEEQAVQDVAVSADYGWFVVVGDTVYRSSDEGETWSAATGGIRYDEPNWPSEFMGGLTAGPDGSVYLTRFKWNDFYSTTPVLRYDADPARWDLVTSLTGQLELFEIGPDGTLVLGTRPWSEFDGRGALVRSADGTAWKRIGDEGLAVAFGAADTLYAGQSDGLFASADGGTTWERASERELAVTRLALHPDGSVLATLGPYVGLVGHVAFWRLPALGVHRLDGEAWSFFGDGLGGTLIDHVEATPDGELLVAAESGTWQSSGGVNEWHRLDEPMAEERVERVNGSGMTSDLEQSTWGDVYSMSNWTTSVRVLRRDSLRWNHVWEPHEDPDWFVAIESLGDSVVLAAGRFGLYRSPDRGATWEEVPELDADAVSAVRVHGRSAYVATETGRLLRADETGATWTEVRVFPAPVAEHGIIAGADGALFVAAGDTLFRRGGSDAEWTPARGDVGDYDRLWMTRDDVLVATRSGRVFLARDASSPFEAVGEPTTGRTLTVEVSTDGTIYAGTREGLWQADARRVAIEDDAPLTATMLGRPYPNPSSGRVRVPFVLERPGIARLAVYDLLGRRVAVLADDHMAPGEHEVEWTATGVAAGVYVVRLVADGRVETQRIIAVR